MPATPDHVRRSLRKALVDRFRRRYVFEAAIEFRAFLAAFLSASDPPNFVYESSPIVAVNSVRKSESSRRRFPRRHSVVRLNDRIGLAIRDIRPF